MPSRLGLGAHIVPIPSTHDAKEWVDKNLGKLSYHSPPLYMLTQLTLASLETNDSGCRIRVISDKARIEFDPQPPATGSAAPSERRETPHLSPDRTTASPLVNPSPTTCEIIS
jgi:hypothetical protein